MSLTQFFSIIKESNYNILEIYSKASNETLIFLALILFIIFVIVFFLRKKVKTSSALKLVQSLTECNSYEEQNSKICLLIEELPKRGISISDALNTCKEHILFRTSKFFVTMSIKEKIEKYLQTSKNYENLAKASLKYNNTELSSFYETKAKELLEKNLFEEIVYYYESVYLNEKEVSNVNAIVKYANSLTSSNTILDPMIKTFNKFSYGYNIDLFKFIEKLDEENSKQVYINCTSKLKELFESGEGEVSINILDYLLQKQEKQKVYEYIKALKLSSYLQQLHNLYFNQKNDINLDLAFIANLTPIEQNYKSYLDESLTSNWRDSEHVEFISKSPGVLDVLGHMEYRTLIERIDRIRIEEENRKMIEEALSIAKRAEIIALEAKSLNKKPIVVPATAQTTQN